MKNSLLVKREYSMNGFCRKGYLFDSDDDKNSNKRKHVVTKDMLLHAHATIADVLTGFPPNVTKIDGKHVWCYSGLEEGLMGWDSISTRKLVKVIKKRMKLGKFI